MLAPAYILKSYANIIYNPIIILGVSKKKKSLQYLTSQSHKKEILAPIEIPDIQLFSIEKCAKILPGWCTGLINNHWQYLVTVIAAQE